MKAAMNALESSVGKLRVLIDHHVPVLDQLLKVEDCLNTYKEERAKAITKLGRKDLVRDDLIDYAHFMIKEGIKSGRKQLRMV